MSNPISDSSANAIAEAIEFNARATDDLVVEQRSRYRFFRYGLMAALAMLAIVVSAGGFGFVHFQNKTEESLRISNEALARSELGFKQSECSWKVQGRYIKQIGLLADSNGASLRGEAVDPARNKARVVELRKASEYVDVIDRICFSATPDPTPLDGVLPDGTVVVVPNE